MVFVTQIVKTSDKLKHSELGQIDPDGSLDLELRSIQKGAIEAALEAYKKKSRQPPSFFAVLLASYGRGVQTTQHVQEAFVTQYVGDAVQDLNQTLRQVYNDKPRDTTSDKLYAPVVALLQSSGSGKTRTAIQLSTLQVGLYVCVRPPPSLGYTTSAPPQDVSAYNSLVPSQSSEDRNDLEALIVVGSWLCAFAIEFFEWLQKHYSRQQPAPSWIGFVRNSAATLYNDIVPGFRVEGAAGFRRSPPAAGIRALPAGPASPNKSHLSIREKLLQDIHDLAESKRREFTEYARDYRARDYRARAGDVMQAPEKHIYAELKEALQKLQDMIPNENYCYLAIDEAASLGPKRLVALRRCLSYHVFPKFRILLLDTSNKVADLTGMEIGDDILPSTFRFENETSVLAPPFTSLPHDIYLWKDPQQADKYGAILTGSVETTFEEIYGFLPLMGRPMLNDQYWCEKGRLKVRGAQKLYNKLIASTAPTVGSSNTNEHNHTDAANRTIAGASQRLPLDLIGVRGGQTVSAFLLKQVALHMRTILHVAISGAEILSWTPSEPLLSLAVTCEYMKDPATHWSDVFEQLADLVQGQHLNYGDHGETTFRGLLSFARDLAFAKHTKRVALDEMEYGRSFISVTEWLAELLGSDLAWTDDARIWADTHWINFTHFQQIGEQFTPAKRAPETLLVDNLIRQAAIHGTPTQPDADFLVPAYFSLTRPQPEQEFSPTNVDVVAGKNRHDQSMSKNNPEWKKDRGAGFIPVKDGRTGRPRCLNLYATMDATPDMTLVEHNGSGSPCIIVKGCTKDQYPLIQQLRPSAAKTLPTFLGRYTRLVDKMHEKYAEQSYDFAFATGRAFIYRKGVDSKTGQPLAAEQSETAQQSEAAERTQTGQHRGEANEGEASDMSYKKRKRNDDNMAIPESKLNTTPSDRR